MKKLLINPLFIILLVVLISCHETKSERWTKADMTHLIQEKTDLKLSEDFSVIVDSVEETEGAMDTDYTYSLSIKYKQLMEKEIVKQIISSAFFDTIHTTNYGERIWDVINSKTKKGIWTSRENGFEFLHCDNDSNRSEPFYLKVDTLSNRIELELIHL